MSRASMRQERLGRFEVISGGKDTRRVPGATEKVEEFLNESPVKTRIVILIVLISMMVGIFLGTMIHAHASREEVPEAYRYYTSVQIQDGDTLWDIASEYYNPDYDRSVKQLVKDIKKINGLGNNTIYSGAYLVVPYYSTQEVW